VKLTIAVWCLAVGFRIDVLGMYVIMFVAILSSLLKVCMQTNHVLASASVCFVERVFCKLICLQ